MIDPAGTPRLSFAPVPLAALLAIHLSALALVGPAGAFVGPRPPDPPPAPADLPGWAPELRPGFPPGLPPGFPLVQPGAGESVPADHEELAGRIRQILQQTGTPGATVALLEEGRLTWSEGFGHADVAAGRAATGRTPFRAGSISKTWVSLAILKLMEEGRLRLDQPVRELVPDVEIHNPWEPTDPLRVIHLVQHTAGFDDMHFSEYAHDDPEPIPLDEALRFNPGARRVRWRPGTHYSYSNVGPAVAARIVEVLTGRTFEDYTTATFFEPLDMQTASWLPTDAIRRDLARGYRDEGRTEVSYWNILYRPAGALNASAEELTHLVRMLLQRGTFAGRRLLEPESIRMMETPSTTLAAAEGLSFGYGMGNYAILGNGFLFQGHDGGMPGYQASYGYVPSGRVGYVIMVNRTGPALARIQAVLTAYLTRKWDRKEPPRHPVDAEVLRSFAGVYRFSTPRQALIGFLTRWITFKIEYENEALFLNVPGFGDVELIPVTDTTFRVPKLAEPLFAFTRDPTDGDRFFQSGFASFVRVSATRLRFERLLMDWVVSLIIGSFLSGLILLLGMVVMGTDDPDALQLRLRPFGCTITLVAWCVLFLVAGDEFISRFGRLTPWSLGAWALSYLYPVAILSASRHVLDVARGGRADGLVLRAGVLCLVHVIMFAYLASWGLIGLRTWAY